MSGDRSLWRQVVESRQRVRVVRGDSYAPPARLVATAVTSSLASGATWVGTVTLAEAFTLFALETDVAARVRLYASEAALTADASRAVGVDPVDDSAPLLEFVTTSLLLSSKLSPSVVGYSMESPMSVRLPLSVTRVASGAGSVSVSLTYLPQGV